MAVPPIRRPQASDSAKQAEDNAKAIARQEQAAKSQEQAEVIAQNARMKTIADLEKIEQLEKNKLKLLSQYQSQYGEYIDSVRELQKLEENYNNAKTEFLKDNSDTNKKALEDSLNKYTKIKDSVDDTQKKLETIVKRSDDLTKILKLNNGEYMKEEVLTGKILKSLTSENTTLEQKKDILKKLWESLRSQEGMIELLNTGFTKGNKLLMERQSINFFGMGKAEIIGLNALVSEMITAPVKIFKEAGDLGNLNKQAKDLAYNNEELKLWNVSLTDLTQSFAGLNQVIPEFNTMNEATQNKLAATSSLAKKLGADINTWNLSLQQQIKIFGKGPEEANKFNESLLEMGKRLGVNDKFNKDYVALAPQLARFGGNQEKIYLDMAMAAKKLGVETAQLLGITEKFTTFEGAADAVGRFNLALGGQYLDTVSLMKDSLDDPVKAVFRLKEAFDASGKSLKQLNSADIRYFASSLGMQEADFRKMMNDKTLDLKKYTEEQQKAQAQEQKMTDMRVNAMDVFEQLSGTINAALKDKDLIEGLKGMVEAFVSIAKAVSGVIGLLNKLGVISQIAYASFVLPFMGIFKLFSGIGTVIWQMGAKAGGALGMIRMVFGNLTKVIFSFIGPLISVVKGLIALWDGQLGKAVAYFASAVIQGGIMAATGGIGGAVTGIGAGIIEHQFIDKMGDKKENEGSSETKVDDTSFYVDPKGNKTVFSPADTVSVYASNQGKTTTQTSQNSSGVEELLKQVIAKLDDIGNRPIEMDGVTVSRQINYASRRDPWRT